MSDTTTQKGPVLAADGTPLKRSLERALRRQKLRALMLIAPLLLFVLITFILPIGDMLFRSVENDIVPETLPLTVVEVQKWDYDSGQAPDEDVYTALAKDLKIAVANKTHTKLGSRLNYEMSGISSMFRKIGRKVDDWNIETDGPFKDKFLSADAKWGDIEVWRTIKNYSGRYTNGYFLNAIDMEKSKDGPRARSEDQQIYIMLFKRTIFM